MSKDINSLIEDVLSNVDIVDVIWRYLPLKRAGSNYKALCPFHREKTPSFVVSPHKQLFKCFGCWIWGNAIKFVMEYEKLSFWEALKMLAQEAKIDISQYDLKKWYESKNINEKEKIYRINSTAADFFQNQLKQSEVAKNYLRQRHISLPVYTKFQLWYAPEGNKTINYLLQQGWDEESILKAGLAKKTSNGLVSFFKNRLIFPLLDPIGNIIWFAGRALNPSDMPKYINIGENLVYDKSKYLYGLNWAKSDYQKVWWLIVVEGYMDVIGLFRIFGKSVGVATSGTALTSHHAKILKRYGENLFLSFDNDQAGYDATIRWLKIAREVGIYPKVIKLKGFKDFDEIANSLESTLDKIETNQYFEIIEWFERLVNHLLEKYSLDDPLGIKKIKDIALEAISHIDIQQDYPIFKLYLDKLAKILKIDSDTLMQQLKIQKAQKDRFQKKPDMPTQTKADNDTLLAALFFNSFGAQLGLDSQFLNLSAQLLKQLDQYISPLLAHTLEGSLNPKEKELIGTKQLEIEQTIDTQKLDHLYSLIKRALNYHLKQAIKFLPPQKKSQISDLYRKITSIQWA